jgi:hypothetical protein
MLGRASDLEALGFLSGEVSLASKPEELLIAIAHRCRKLINTGNNTLLGSQLNKSQTINLVIRNGIVTAPDMVFERYRN